MKRTVILFLLLLMVNGISFANTGQVIVTNASAGSTGSTVNIGNTPTVNIGNQIESSALYSKAINLDTSTGIDWTALTLTANAVEININTAQNAYIGYDSTANYLIVDNTLGYQNFKLPSSVTTLYWKHITTTGDIYIEEMVRQ